MSAIAENNKTCCFSVPKPVKIAVGCLGTVSLIAFSIISYANNYPAMGTAALVASALPSACIFYYIK